MPKGVYLRTDKHKSCGFQKGHKVNFGKRLALGYRWTSEQKNNLSEVMEGNIHSEETKEKIRQTHLGMKPSEETREKLRLSHLGQTAWNKGKQLVENRISPYVISWNSIRKAIYKRDSWVCQECGIKCGKYIACHHIDYNPSNNDSNNLITLCKSCHSKTNFRREDWTNRYKKTMGGVPF